MKPEQPNIESLKEIYRVVSEPCCKPDAEQLQDLGNLLERSELVQTLEY